MGRARAVCSAVVFMLAAGLTGCGAGPVPPSITVFAAASLEAVFTEIAEQFKVDNPGVAVAFNFAGSSDLATQLALGARADVFASANTTQMDKVAQAGLVDGSAVPFATNTLAIVTAPGNPHHVRSFADLALPGLAVVVCQEPVPCGAATSKVAQATGVEITPVSEEPDVTDVLGKVTTGQADAGVVYRTDALHAGDKVATIEFPEAAGAVNTYPIAVLREAPRPGPGRAFMDLVTGEQGSRMLRAAGFGKP
ncbi:molybdate ABC transporter substrate-binding protein [Mycolicibacter minnesotensis]|uniref:Molybdate ABC transporter substrate-binding protein n=1 Tax=Mycolicibacter minnesotensis TaxID=1118379 RepID=A0A7I7RBE8_9MYCO|nr:molybdate ABC transporter substrate-binding protein [Mycolicibacter minnesotensis]ORB03120.1 molybdate ABC transporter substrate-binding protein [Mycolicibacter minnesotensis]BBY35527.1 molybdate-binding protein [Mycolicibacter minnesotensis]